MLAQCCEGGGGETPDCVLRSLISHRAAYPQRKNVMGKAMKKVEKGDRLAVAGIVKPHDIANDIERVCKYVLILTEACEANRS